MPDDIEPVSPASSPQRPDRRSAARTPLDALAGSAFSRVAEAEEVKGNRVRLLRDGTENFPRWIEAIDRARSSVHLENYILQEDALGGRFATALAAAASRGVACRVLYDWMGSRRRTSPAFWQRLRDAGVEVRCYNPPRPTSPLGWVSRDHRKVLCVDGKVAFTGGLCIGQDWLGDPARGIPPWRDTAVEIIGPAVGPIEAAFADSWAVTGPPIPAAERFDGASIPVAGDLGLWVIPGRPDTMGLYRLEQLVAEIAQRSLWISDAYFVATTGYARALTGAARAGVDVRILIPGVSNIPVVGSLSRAGYHGLLEAGVRVFEWNGPMMHAKTAVADGCWSRVGSSNSNLASWISNRELDIAIHDPGFAAEMEAMFLQDLENATEVVLTGSRVRPVGFDAGDLAARLHRRSGSASRMLAGAVGVGSAVSATVAQHRAVGRTEVPILAAAGAILVILAIIAIVLPALLAYPLAAAALWVASTLFARAWRLRKLPLAEIVPERPSREP
jgi:cardiolipin synthase